MKERPILFSGPMVKAILDGRKSMTRRVVKPQPEEGYSIDVCNYSPSGFALWHDGGCTCRPVKTTYGLPADRLWIRETCCLPAKCTRQIDDDYETFIIERPELVKYPATDEPIDLSWKDKGGLIKRPSIHMPRWASRITLEITGVKVERLQDISIDDIEAEGVYRVLNSQDDQRDTFLNKGNWIDLWDSINGKTYPWSSNPFVWCISFKRIKP